MISNATFVGRFGRSVLERGKSGSFGLLSMDERVGIRANERRVIATYCQVATRSAMRFGSVQSSLDLLGVNDPAVLVAGTHNFGPELELGSYHRSYHHRSYHHLRK